MKSLSPPLSSVSLSPVPHTKVNFPLVALRSEEFPENILQATANLKTVNIIPAIGEFC